VFSPCSSMEPSAELFCRKCMSVIPLTVCEHPNIDTQKASITVHILFVSAAVYKYMVEVHIKRVFFFFFFFFVGFFFFSVLLKKRGGGGGPLILVVAVE